MHVQIPFYVIKRTAVTKEAAMALFVELLGGDDTLHKNASDLIDFCLSGPKEEKVFLSIGDKVRLKKNDGWVHGFPNNGEAVFSSAPSPGIRLKFESGNDYTALYPDSADLSDYVELL